MAAEVLSTHNLTVHVYDAMPSVGRKFLMAGKGGMNITHAEPAEQFITRYGTRQAQLKPLLQAFSTTALREWVHNLGIDTFVGTSGRIFPVDMKAAPLLRAWLHRLRNTGVQFHMRHRWLGWDAQKNLRFETPTGILATKPDTVILALGGGSWAKLGSDGQWIALLLQQGITAAPLKPANCGFNTHWSDYFQTRFAGTPLKNIAIKFEDTRHITHEKSGELMITAHGVEGSLIYAISALLRDKIEADGHALIHLDLAPNKAVAEIVRELAHPRGSRSMASHLQSRLNIKGIKSGLLRELVPSDAFADAVQLANAIKSLPVKLTSTRPLDESISSAGGVQFEDLNNALMLNRLPGVFCAGEMLDWEAPTGGYLLTACLASGYAAGKGALAWLQKNSGIAS
ncbi:MAG: aminoacetone oxidase family FAD-binding enzyme [Betaproteobacteria bacterium HGW-Betaproteobacteria-22]|nr:MAG: aminoacetone oxidase family FAD-binding enzyme [Betaproteobacteria bacterium HGW-Betaproteobacteria-22]